MLIAPPSTVFLSVPSNRVEPLQPFLSHLVMSLITTFSTLKPGRTSATSRRWRWQHHHVPLSVPSNRVEPLQQNLYLLCIVLFDFQYPQTQSNLYTACPPPAS